jgi:hypothetical protein
MEFALSIIQNGSIVLMLWWNDYHAILIFQSINDAELRKRKKKQSMLPLL